MEINKTFKDKSCKIELSGRLDTITSPQLEEALNEVPADAEELILDLKELETANTGRSSGAATTSTTATRPAAHRT